MNVKILIVSIVILILFLKAYQYFYKTASKIRSRIKLQLSKKSDAKTNFRKEIKHYIISQNPVIEFIFLPIPIVFFLIDFF